MGKMVSVVSVGTGRTAGVTPFLITSIFGIRDSYERVEAKSVKTITCSRIVLVLLNPALPIGGRVAKYCRDGRREE